MIWRILPTLFRSRPPETSNRPSGPRFPSPDLFPVRARCLAGHAQKHSIEISHIGKSGAARDYANTQACSPQQPFRITNAHFGKTPRQRDAVLRSKPATKSETAHVQPCGQFIDVGSHAPAKARSQVNGHFFAKIEVTLHNKVVTEKGKVPPSDRTKCLLILETECVSFAAHRFCSQTIYEGFITGDLDVEDEPHKASGVLHDIDKRPYAFGGGAKPTCDFINGTVTTGCRKYEEHSTFSATVVRRLWRPRLVAAQAISRVDQPAAHRPVLLRRSQMISWQFSAVTVFRRQLLPAASPE